jgi:hypothetical protein
MNDSRQRGISLFAVIAALLVGIALLLGLLVLSSSETTQDSTCETNLVTLQTQYRNFLAACAVNDTVSAISLVTQMNTLIAQWNTGQCVEFGTLPAQAAHCSGQN